MNKSQGVELLKWYHSYLVFTLYIPIIVKISLILSSDNKLESFTNTDVDLLSAQVCQLERKEEQALPGYALALQLETFLTAGTKLHDKCSCERVCDP